MKEILKQASIALNSVGDSFHAHGRTSLKYVSSKRQPIKSVINFVPIYNDIVYIRR